MLVKNHRWAWLTLFVVALASFSGAGDGRWKLAPGPVLSQSWTLETWRGSNLLLG